MSNPEDDALNRAFEDIVRSFGVSPDTTGAIGSAAMSGGDVPPGNKPPGGDHPADEEPDEPEEPQRSGLGPWLMLPDGKAVDVGDMLARARREGEPQIDTSVLRAGDFVVFGGEEEGDSIVFEITDTRWGGLKPGGKPQLKTRGQLRGANVPPDAQDIEVELWGSGHGGTSIMPGVLATDRIPYFGIPGRYGDLPLHNYRYTETFRPDGGDLKSISPNVLDRQAQREIQQHTDLVARAKAMGQELGFDISARYGHSVEAVRHDRRYEVERATSQLDGNSITVYNRRSGQWVQVRYNNTDNRDSLQIVAAQITPEDRANFLGGIGATSNANRARGDKIAYTSSNRLGLWAAHYTPSDEDATRILGIPQTGAGDVFMPDIIIHADGQLEINQTSDPYSVLAENTPGLAERVAAAITTGVTRRGERYIALGKKRIVLPSPESILRDIERAL